MAEFLEFFKKNEYYWRLPMNINTDPEEYIKHWDVSNIWLNPNLTIEFVLAHPEIGWSINHLSKIININDIIKCNSIKWNFDMVSQNKSVTINHVMENLDKPWNFNELSKILPMTDILTRPELFNSNWFGQNPSITVQMIKSNDWNINFRDLSSCPNITIGYLLKNKNKKWNWYELTKNFDIDIIINHQNLELVSNFRKRLGH